MKKNILYVLVIITIFFSFSKFTSAVINPNYGYKDADLNILACGYETKTSCETFLKNQYPDKTLTCTIGIICADTDPGTESDPIEIDPQTTSDQGDGGEYELLAPIGEFRFAPKNIGEYFNTIFLIAIGLCGALAVIMIVLGGIQYMGDESIFGKTEAKSKIMAAILGLLIALGSYALLNTINPDLLNGGVRIDQVSAEIEEIVTEVGPGVNIGGSQVRISTGKAVACKGGIVNIPSNMGSGKICKDLLDKLVILKSKNPNWRITSAIRGRNSQSSCHHSGYPNSGNCVDLQITNNPQQGYSKQNGSTNPSWGTFCVDVAQVGGLNYLNEASKVTNCQNIQNYKTYKYTSGPHLHVNLISN